MSEPTDADLSDILTKGISTAICDNPHISFPDATSAGRRALYEAGKKDGYKQGWNEIYRLREALTKIESVGTRTETVRIGDPYSEDGWEEHQIISEEAEIARVALEAALSVTSKEGAEHGR